MRHSLMTFAVLVSSVGTMLPPKVAQAAEPEAATATAPTVDERKAEARKTFDALVSDYNKKNRSAFMKRLAGNFVGETGDLENALTQDFKNYRALQLSVTPKAPAVKDQLVIIEFHYDLVATNADGAVQKRSGDSEFEFIAEGGKTLLYFMRPPIIFGRAPVVDLEAAARDTIAKLTDAYSGRRRSAFMKLVSADYLGDSSLLEAALLSDFKNYPSVNLAITIDSARVDKERVTVDFHYNLAVVDRQGNNNNFKGSSSFIFNMEEGVAKLYKMATPLIFGNSLPASENPQATSQGASTNAGGSAPGAANVAAISGSAKLAGQNVGFRFRSQSSQNDPTKSDVFSSGTKIGAGGAIQDISSCSLNSLSSVPSHISGPNPITPTVGDCYAVQTLDGQYAAIKVTSVNPINGAIGFDYVFQPNGTTAFR